MTYKSTPLTALLMTSFLVSNVTPVVAGKKGIETSTDDDRSQYSPSTTTRKSPEDIDPWVREGFDYLGRNKAVLDYFIAENKKSYDTVIKPASAQRDPKTYWGLWWGEIDPLNLELAILDLNKGEFFKDLEILQNLFSTINDSYARDDSKKQARKEQERIGQKLNASFIDNIRHKGLKPEFLYWTVNHGLATMLRDYSVTRGNSSPENLEVLAKVSSVIEKYKDHWPARVKGQMLMHDKEDIYSVFDAYYTWACLDPDDSDKAKGPFGDLKIPFLGKAFTGIRGQNSFARSIAFCMDVIQRDALYVQSVSAETDGQKTSEKEKPVLLPPFHLTYDGKDPSVFAGQHPFYYEKGDINSNVTEAFIRFRHLLGIDATGSLDEYWVLSQVPVLFTQDVWWNFTRDLLAGHMDSSDERVMKIIDLAPYVHQSFQGTMVKERIVACLLKVIEDNVTPDRFDKFTELQPYALFNKLKQSVQDIVMEYGSKTVLRCDVTPLTVDTSEIGRQGSDKCLIPESTQTLFRHLATLGLRIKSTLQTLSDEMNPFHELYEKDKEFFYSRAEGIISAFSDSLMLVVGSEQTKSGVYQENEGFLKHYHISMNPSQGGASQSSKTEPVSGKSKGLKAPREKHDDDSE